jgi:lipoyl(octanoyl) transferase
MRSSLLPICVIVFAFSRKSLSLYRAIKVLDISDSLVSYKEAFDWQERIAEKHIKFQIDDSMRERDAGVLLLLQHRSVYTLGTGTTEHSGPFSTAGIDGKPLEYETFRINRAGQATYHGPGQLVCYPIIDLNYFEKDINSYLRNLEEVVIRTLAVFDIKGSRVHGLTGVWVGESKLAAIGIKISRWVTMHGVALNVNPDLRYFSNIIPCGVQDKAVGSMEQYCPGIHIQDVKNSMIDNFAGVFKCECEVLDDKLSLKYIEQSN